LLKHIVDSYVDTISYKRLVEESIPIILEQLDPHSLYIPASEREAMDEPIRGNFEGIGIQFNMRNDTVYVIQTIAGGPSEKIGIIGGDRLTHANDTLIAGIGLTSDKVMTYLKGPKGTKVKVTIVRQGVKTPLHFTITRDKIPIHSIDVSYMATKNIGYIKISRFSQTTYREFIEKITELKQKGMRKLMLDLRGNGGGVMSDAIMIADEFLSSGKLILYTQGKARNRMDYSSSAQGFLQNDEVVILIDELSASASEILAGAIQDNDRGTIIGRRSFGKGLVQEPIYFEDGSELRLTVARYYTPTGRSIQKPYSADYDDDLINRYYRGEFTEKDSIKQNDTLIYLTPKGKTVYGGGGIMPDVFVPADTTSGSKFFKKVRQMGVDFQFSYYYADLKRNELQKLQDIDAFEEYLDKQDIMKQFVNYAVEKEIKYPYVPGSDKILEKQVKALIVRNIKGEQGFYMLMHQVDPTFKKGLEILQ
jgi:carboxyl-terminal processing protease